MAGKQSFFRHLPPTAVPLKSGDLSAGLRPHDDALPRFVNALAAYLGVEAEAFLLASSGRSALYCLLQGLKLEQPNRKRVIMPAYTCPAVARVAIDLALTPVYVDLSAQTMAYDLQQVDHALNEKTLAVVLVHPFGIPLPTKEILTMARNVGAATIEDAAQSLGAQWAGQPVGTQGDFGLFSLGPGKPISTGGGGFVIANSDEGIETLNRGRQALSQPGSFASIQAWARQGAFQLAFHPRGWWAATKVGLHRVGNHEASWGYNLTGLTPAQAAVGSRLLPRLPEINDSRRRKAEMLSTSLESSTSLHSISVMPGAEPIYLRFPIIAQNYQQREALYEQFWAKGIGVGRLYEKALPHIFDANDNNAYPGAEKIANCLLTLPTHHYVTEGDLQLMCDILASG